MSANVTSTNPVVQAIVGGEAPQPARLAAARGMLPLAQDDLIEVLVALKSDSDEEIAQAARSTLEEQETPTLLNVASADATSSAVLTYLASRPATDHQVQEALALNPRTPDGAIVELAMTTGDSAVLEVIAINQQRLIRSPKIIEALLWNPARTPEVERRARETQREFFEKERGQRQIADELRARGKSAAAEFIESAESVGVDDGISIDDFWFIAEHIEVSDAEVDDSWVPWEHYEEIFEETMEQRAANAERITAEVGVEAGGVAEERLALIRRVMFMKVKDRIKLGMKGDREARSILIRDANKVVAQAVIQNPRITDHEIEGIAAMRTVADVVLRLIALNRGWARSYPIIHNLVRNPRTPLGSAMTILPRIYTKDLKTLSQNRNVSDAVRRHAVRLVNARGG
jgi:hypothetical protein